MSIDYSAESPRVQHRRTVTIDQFDDEAWEGIDADGPLLVQGAVLDHVEHLALGVTVTVFDQDLRNLLWDARTGAMAGLAGGLSPVVKGRSQSSSALPERRVS